MPLTRISLGTAWRPAEFAQLSALFHECLVAEFDVPSADRFQFIERAADEQRIYDPHYLSEGRSARFVLFHIFAGKPRSRAQKQGLYRRLCARLDDERPKNGAGSPPGWCGAGAPKPASWRRL